MAKSEQREASSVQSAERALRVVRLLAHTGRVRVSDVSRRLDVAPSTAHRLLVALEREGFAAHSGSGRSYIAGPGLHAIMTAGPERDRDLLRVAMPVLRELAERSGETVHLSWLRGRFSEFAAVVEGDRMVRVASRLGMAMPAHTTSGGKAVLAQLDETFVADLYRDADWDAPTEHSIRSLPALREELAVVRERGWAVNDRESELDLRAVGVAVVDQHGVARAALAVAVPLSRLPREDVGYLAAEVSAAAQRIEHALAAVEASPPAANADDGE
jgi:DNA-binding IclR family transcriptional regulator